MPASRPVRSPPRLLAFPLTAVLGAALVLPAAALEDLTPKEWLDRMAQVVSTVDFEGTVIRRRNGHAEALKVVHRVVDGVVKERVVTQEGSGLEIIRNGNEVHCILPDKKSVLIEQWNDQSTLFSTLPKSDVEFGSEYDVSIVREERVAGRRALLLAIRPHDGYRFGHRLWLDRETAFPLRTELVDASGRPVEQLKFADITLNSSIPDQALAPSFSLDDFTWYSEPTRAEVLDIETDWVSDDLPAGFRVISTKTEELPGAESPVTHIVYGDGLATVSVFIADRHEDKIARYYSVGTANSYSTVIDGRQVTAVGEVPSATVERIAQSMRRQ